MLEPGTPAPDFTATDHRGQSISLAGLRGKTVVLWFYPAADTPGCTAEGCGFRDAHEHFENADTVIIGVSFDEAKYNQAFAEKYEFPFSLISDTDRAIGLAYGACQDADAPAARRIAVVIDPEGKIKEYHSRVDPRIFPADLAARL